MTFPALRFILAIATVSALAGCAAPVSIKTYGGPQLAPEETATLLVDRQIFVSDVADYETGITLATKDQSAEGTQFELKPGPQEITFSFYSYRSGSDTVGVPTKPTIVTTYTSVRSVPLARIRHDFQKGRKYEMHYTFANETLDARIVDVTTGGSKRSWIAAWGEN